MLRKSTTKYYLFGYGHIQRVPKYTTEIPSVYDLDTLSIRLRWSFRNQLILS